jgi:hypothetical protein
MIWERSQIPPAKLGLYDSKERSGGMGILDLRDLNVCLLASWVQRFYTRDQKMWKSVVEHKYHPNSPNIFCYVNRQSSPF